MAETAIREGFLCPMCMKDLGTVTQLTHHFEEAHSNEDKAVLQQLKGLFGKAKRKILAKVLDEENEEGAFGGDAGLSVAGINLAEDPTFWEPQDMGATRSLTDSFKRVRDARVDRFVVETNKLLIRLDKLLSSEAPTEPNKRKAFEKSVVQWAPDSDVNLCATCGKQFSLTRRRHHCRLCGGIMCNKCSQFLPFSYAKKLTNPAFTVREDVGFHRSSSNSSLNSMLSPEGEPHIRTCTECRMLLERRDQQVEMRNTKPAIVQLYEKMRLYVDEADASLPAFLQMVDSLLAGETSYSLMAVQTKRIKLLKLYENIDALSKRIAGLGLNSAELPSAKAVQLQKTIRMYASSYLQENMLGLQSLPSQEEIEKLQEAKRQEVQRRIASERMAAAERERRRQDEHKHAHDPEKSRQPQSAEKSDLHKRSDSVTKAGWKPMEVARQETSDDPMVQQMNIIRGYVKQARDAQKWDEVQMLEQNLKELQHEYWRQQGSSFHSPDS